MRRVRTGVAITLSISLIAAACAAPGPEPTPEVTPGPTPDTAATPEPVTPTPDPGDDGVAEARAMVESLSGPAAFDLDAPALDVGDSLEGRRIYAIGNGLEFFFVQNWLSGVNEAAAELGMIVTAVDAAAADPAGLIEQAVAQDFDVILLQSVDSATVAAPLTEAAEAGIPVIELTTSDPQLPSPEAQQRGVFGYVTFCYSCAGEQMAAFVVADGGEGAKGVIYNVPGLVVSEAMVDAFEAEMNTLCPSCETEVIEAPFAQWGELQGLTSTTIERNAHVERLYLVPVFDAMVPIGVAAAVAEKQAEDQVKIVTYNGTDAGLPGVADGTVAADIGGPQVWLGWATVDQVARALLGEAPVEDQMLPHRIFWTENIGEIDLNAAEDTWYGDTDFRSEYRQLWGIAD